MMRMGTIMTVLVLLALVGCAALGGGSQAMGNGPAGSQPAVEGQANSTQQSGIGNVAANLATSLKGIEYNSVLPAGLAVLLVFQMMLNAFGLWLSHRREVIRIKQVRPS